MRRLLSATIMLAIASTAVAATVVNEQSNRIERVEYAENKVLKIAAVVKQPFLIEFKNDELIEDVVGGTIAGWEVQKKGYHLYVRALDKAEDTTLLVTSRRRSYVFDLSKVKATPRNLEHRASKIVFDYPGTSIAQSLPGAGMMSFAPPAVQTAAAPPPPAPASTPAGPPLARNENYTMQVVSESADIKPRAVFDDGRFTWFRFPASGEIPAIYKGERNSKEEVLVNSHMEGDFVVMHAISPLWNLRLAQSMVGVFNESYDPQGVAPANGTTVRGLARESRK